MNLKNETFQALQELRGHPAFQVFRADLHRLASTELYTAAGAAPENRVHATSYAKAIVDLWVLIEAASTNVTTNKIEKPLIGVPAAVQEALESPEMEAWAAAREKSAPPPIPAGMPTPDADELILGTRVSKGAKKS